MNDDYVNDDMNLDKWVKNNFTRIQIFNNVELKNGMQISNKLNRDLTLGLLSTDNVAEWRDLCFLYAPVGTIKTDIPEEYYADRLLLLRNELTKLLFDTDNRTLAEKYIKILEKRDKNHWADQNKTIASVGTSVTASTKDQTLNITFV